ncbi:hypothetical protein Fmac_019379 [Flemingia macrophylla]|uniref:BHLH domain-containing protein n=1 Tax=Flemingia macrophylla TaxID=520843 RepID=A0ABD1M7M1_9FABA
MFSGEASWMEAMFSGVRLQSLVAAEEGWSLCGVAEGEWREQKRQRVVIPQSKLARQRRQKLSEKTRCLQKLMPWDKKMDQATLLEEAYKYVKFLQAQFRVLQSMPSSTSTSTSSSASSPFLLPNDGVFGHLQRLNRTQLLQVLVNSPVAQTMLYSQGFCVFSLEQLSLLRKFSQTTHHHLHLHAHPSN